MSREKKNIKKEYDSNEAPPATPYLEEENKINDYFPICPECSSSIEILSINEENNVIEFNCIENNKTYIMSIKEYLEKIKEYKEKNIDELKDKCKIHFSNYISYCCDCNCHLCSQCLQTRTHINHRKNNIIEIKPIEEELNIIKEVIKDYKMKLNEIKNEEKNKKKELKDILEKEEKNEKKKLDKKIEDNKIKEKEELELINNKYKDDIEEIKRRYEKEIKLRKNKYEKDKNNINNKYKMINEEINIKYKIKIEELNKEYKNTIKNFEFEKKKENCNNILKINEIIYNIYNEYNNNYYNSVNINKILLYYSESKYINNNIMKKILKEKYEEILRIIKQKSNEDNKLKLLKEKKNEEKINKIEEKYKKEIEKINHNYNYIIFNIDYK